MHTRTPFRFPIVLLTLLLLVSSILIESGSFLGFGAPFFQREYTSKMITIMRKIGPMTAGIIHHLIVGVAEVGTTAGLVSTTKGLGAVRTYRTE